MSSNQEGWAAATRMLATHMLSIGGVVLASQRTLATYLAVSSLTRPTMPARPEDVDLPSNASGIKAFISKPQVKKTVMIILAILATLAFYAFIAGVFVAAFRFASQLVLDMLLVSIFGGFFTWTIWRTLEIALSLPSTVAYKAQFPKATEKEKKGHWRLETASLAIPAAEWYRQKRNGIAMSTGLGSLIMISAACGYDLPLILLPASWIVPVVSSYIFPRMSMRRVSQVMVGYISVMLVLLAIIVPVATYFGNKQNAKTPEELDKEHQDQAEDAKNWTLPSAWIESLFSLTHYLYVIAGPGIFIALNWRFDYAQQHGAHLGLQAQDSVEEASRLVPALDSLPTFAPRISIYAIGSLILSVIGLTGTFTINEAIGEGLSGSTGLLVIVPVMLASTVFGAWRHGVLKEWWAYTELWIPTPGDEELATIGSNEIIEHCNGKTAS